jgi:hypothetical protein
MKNSNNELLLSFIKNKAIIIIKGKIIHEDKMPKMQERC